MRVKPLERIPWQGTMARLSRIDQSLFCRPDCTMHSRLRCVRRLLMTRFSFPKWRIERFLSQLRPGYRQGGETASYRGRVKEVKAFALIFRLPFSRLSGINEDRVKRREVGTIEKAQRSTCRL